MTSTGTRRVKAAGSTWTVQEKKGRKTFSRGVWAPADRIAAVRVELASERSTDAYAKRRAAETARRDRKQTEYVEDFRGAVLAFLDFAPGYAGLAERSRRLLEKYRAGQAVGQTCPLYQVLGNAGSSQT